jgi:hypothetical protein
MWVSGWYYMGDLVFIYFGLMYLLKCFHFIVYTKDKYKEFQKLRWGHGLLCLHYGSAPVRNPELPINRGSPGPMCLTVQPRHLKHGWTQDRGQPIKLWHFSQPYTSSSLTKSIDGTTSAPSVTHAHP